jgi:hypothetical protein
MHAEIQSVAFFACNQTELNAILPTCQAAHRIDVGCLRLLVRVLDRLRQNSTRQGM